MARQGLIKREEEEEKGAPGGRGWDWNEGKLRARQHSLALEDDADNSRNAFLLSFITDDANNDEGYNDDGHYDDVENDEQRC